MKCKKKIGRLKVSEYRKRHFIKPFNKIFKQRLHNHSVKHMKNTTIQAHHLKTITTWFNKKFKVVKKRKSCNRIKISLQTLTSFLKLFSKITKITKLKMRMLISRFGKFKNQWNNNILRIKSNRHTSTKIKGTKNENNSK